MTGFFENILTGIFNIIGNYGWAVIIFSLLIKLVLLPLDFKSRRSMRAMTALNPKMEELKKRYANDQEKLNQKMGELYRKNKVNPLSGCLPMLLQLPILFIMFAAMRNIAAELQLDQMYKWVMTNFVDNAAWLELTQSVEWPSLRNILLSVNNLASLNDSQITTLHNLLATCESPTVTAVINGLISGEGVQAFGSVFHAADNQSVIDFIQLLGTGKGAEIFTDTNGWLWVKNIFQPDSFTKTTVLTGEELRLMLGQYAKKIDNKNELALLRLYAGFDTSAVSGSVNGLAASVDTAISDYCGFKRINLIFNIVTINFPMNLKAEYINGWLILPILAGVTQLLQTKLTPTAENSSNQNGTGKFMKWFFPFFSVWICLSSTAAFAAYWVFVNIFSIVTNFVINKVLEKQTPVVSETEKEAIQP